MLLAGDESDHRDNLGLVREPRSFESFVAVNGRTVRAWQTGCWWAGETRCDHVTQSETRADSSPLRTSTRHCIVYSIFFSIGLALDFIFSHKWIQEIKHEKFFFLFKYRRHHGRAARLVAVIFSPWRRHISNRNSMRTFIFVRLNWTRPQPLGNITAIGTLLTFHLITFLLWPSLSSSSSDAKASPSTRRIAQLKAWLLTLDSSESNYYTQLVGGAAVVLYRLRAISFSLATVLLLLLLEMSRDIHFTGNVIKLLRLLCSALLNP